MHHACMHTQPLCPVHRVSHLVAILAETLVLVSKQHLVAMRESVQIAGAPRSHR